MFRRSCLSVMLLAVLAIGSPSWGEEFPTTLQGEWQMFSIDGLPVAQCPGPDVDRNIEPGEGIIRISVRKLDAVELTCDVGAVRDRDTHLDVRMTCYYEGIIEKSAEIWWRRKLDGKDMLYTHNPKLKTLLTYRRCS
ncbi:MAG: hypothetical protein NW216_02365 [Hyphomicrobium sp.]|nr:hypothetical protein [Hyphomicrobium sp.]